tara:strand:- start:230 stop:889 length:660 start_codon:yes stop_codon:yes gene_type:complete
MLMSVSLVGMTTPSAVTGCNTANELIAYAARVSNPENQNNEKTAPKLLKYLIKNEHWSPFEMVSVTLEIKTTRDISRQIIRHRSFSFQEFSQRYAESTNFEIRDCRMQDEKNRQNSIEAYDPELSKWWESAQQELIQKSKMTYQSALDHGIAKEQARAVLPEGNTETTLYMAGTLRSWIHYCKLRRANGTQLEHIKIADQCWDVLSHHFPDVAKAVEEL